MDVLTSPDVLVISETKLKLNHLPINIDIQGYDLIHSDSAKNSGGVGFYIKETLDCNIFNDVNIDTSDWVVTRCTVRKINNILCYVF